MHVVGAKAVPWNANNLSLLPSNNEDEFFILAKKSLLSMVKHQISYLSLPFSSRKRLGKKVLSKCEKPESLFFLHRAADRALDPLAGPLLVVSQQVGDHRR
jgi:hypothetical protein